MRQGKLKQRHLNKSHVAFMLITQPKLEREEKERKRLAKVKGTPIPLKV